MYIPQTSSNLSSEALRFLTKELRVARPKMIPQEPYIHSGANLPKIAITEKEMVEAKKHEYLSPSAIAQDVRDFAANIDMIV